MDFTDFSRGDCLLARRAQEESSSSKVFEKKILPSIFESFQTLESKETTYFTPSMFDKLGWAMRHADDDEELRAILR